MRRALFLLGVLAATALGIVVYRTNRMMARERAYIAGIERLVTTRATRATVEADIGPPESKQKAPKCPEEWTYRLGGDRVAGGDRIAVLCFDESGRAASVSVGMSINRQDY